MFGQINTLPIILCRLVFKANMASGDVFVLPVYQRYINGVPVSTNRRILRLREKYVILLVLISFGSVCFGAFFFLPDLRDRMNVMEIKRQLDQAGGDIFMPRADEDVAKRLHFKAGELEDSRKLRDKAKLQEKIEWDKAQDEVLRKIRTRLNISKEHHDQVRQVIADDKEKVVRLKEQEEEQKKEEERQKALKVVKDHDAVDVEKKDGAVNLDEQTKQRRETVKQVGNKYNGVLNIIHLRLAYCVACTISMGRIWNFIQNRISSKLRIEYEYSVAWNSIRILNTVCMSCREAASSCGHGHKSEPELSALWPNASLPSIFLLIF